MVTLITPVQRFNEITDTGLIIYAQDKVDRISASSKYPAAFPLKDAVAVTIPLYTHALAKAVNGSKADTQIKNDLRDRLERELTFLGWMCSILSITDLGMFLESGFDYRRKGETVEKFAPTGLEATEGDEDSSILVSFDSMEGANSYVVQMTDNINNEASFKDVGFPTASEFLVTGLIKGKQYWFRVAAVYAAGLSDWSDPATRIAV